MHRHILNSISVNSHVHKATHPEKLSLADTTECFLAISMMFLGVACILWTHDIYKLFPFLLSGIMIILGLHHVIYGIITKEYKNKETKLIANGAVYLILGVVIIIRRKNADPLIGAIWGVIGLITGIEELNEAIYHLARKEPFLFKALRAAFELVLGILLLIDPASAMSHHIFILGMELIIEGIKLFFFSEANFKMVEQPDMGEYPQKRRKKTSPRMR